MTAWFHYESRWASPFSISCCGSCTLLQLCPALAHTSTFPSLSKLSPSVVGARQTSSWVSRRSLRPRAPVPSWWPVLTLWFRNVHIHNLGQQIYHLEPYPISLNQYQPLFFRHILRLVSIRQDYNFRRIFHSCQPSQIKIFAFAAFPYVCLCCIDDH